MSNWQLDTNEGGGGEEFRDAALHLQTAEGELAAVVDECQKQVAHADRSRRDLEVALSEQEPLRIKLGDNIRNAKMLDEQIASLESERQDAGAKLDQSCKQLELTASGVSSGRANQINKRKPRPAREQHAPFVAAERRLIDVRATSRVPMPASPHGYTATRIRERIAVLSSWSRLEGLDGGVQEILESLRIPNLRDGRVAPLFSRRRRFGAILESHWREGTIHRARVVRQLLESLQCPLRVAGRIGFSGLIAEPTDGG
jgi:hypothetical protein